jgi:two-component system, chemotaxis family, protein-glutamate methylesterase/glutaminase
MAAPLSVLIVDDSEISRHALRAAVQSEPGLEVIGEAQTGEEAIRLARQLKPMLITMDLNMPGMGGLKAIELILKERPVPVVVISEKSASAGIDLNYEAISRGALELISKGSLFGHDDSGLAKFAQHLRQLTEGFWLKQSDSEKFLAPATIHLESPKLLGIGASTGGPRALAKLLRALPRDFPVPIAVVQHMAEDFFDSFVRFLADASGLRVQLITPNETLVPGRVYVGPPRHEVFIKENLSVRLSPAPLAALFSPSVDSLFFSMANALKARSIGVLLTGMGDDGAQGLLKMRRAGAHTLVQNRESSAVWGMPHAAYILGAAEHILSIEEISKQLAQLVHPSQPPSARSTTAAPDRRASESLPVEKSAKRKALRLLLVDDDPDDLESARLELVQLGFEVVAIDNPMLLASRLIRERIDVLILESELSTVDTPSLLATLRKRDLATGPVVIFSRLTGEALTQKARNCNTPHAASKPNIEALTRILSRLSPSAPGVMR